MSVATLIERFWRHITFEPNTGCWLWTGALLDKNDPKLWYGVLWHGEDNSRVVLAHRLSWELHRGPIPEGHGVFHHCDFPPCVNPAHLFTGEQAANIADMMAKGRHVLSIEGFRAKHAARAALTHCKRGHPLTEDNIQQGAWLKRGHRECTACHTERHREWKARQVLA